MDSTRPFVVFKHENEEFVLQNEQIVLNRYHREYFGKTIVDFETKSSHKYVRQFFAFLQTGKVPSRCVFWGMIFPIWGILFHILGNQCF